MMVILTLWVYLVAVMVNLGLFFLWCNGQLRLVLPLRVYCVDLMWCNYQLILILPLWVYHITGIANVGLFVAVRGSFYLYGYIFVSEMINLGSFVVWKWRIEARSTSLGLLYYCD